MKAVFSIFCLICIAGFAHEAIMMMLEWFRELDHFGWWLFTFPFLCTGIIIVGGSGIMICGEIWRGINDEPKS